jgi:NAD(P)-dependent dehydrogenase (short-subunit alcohol dehydrogenase family)
MLTGQTILVTGAGGGIGRATALLIAAAGANVIVSDISAQTAELTVEQIHEAGGQASSIIADLGEEAQVIALIRRIIERHGRLHGAFNNAGIEQHMKPLHELTTPQWDRVIRVNLTSVFWCMKHEIEAMLAGGGGSIVNTASSLGQVGIANAAEYVASKHGVMGLTRAAAADYGARGIRVNAVLPGVTRTPMMERGNGLGMEDPTFVAFLNRLKERHPIGRFGEPHEIGAAVQWLLSDAASFVNGATLAVDGGYLAV